MHQVRYLPGNNFAFRTCSEAWHWAVGYIGGHGGWDVVTEDGQMTREVRNLELTITDPGKDWPVKDSGWDMPALDQYANQLIAGEHTDHDYNYGERLRHGLLNMPSLSVASVNDAMMRREYGVDQVKIACEMLTENRNTRRAAMFLWEPQIDLGKPKSHPCMMVVDPLIRGDRLHLAAMFRSHDFGRPGFGKSGAYVENVYGLWRLSEHMSGIIGVDTGEITTFSVSAHFYWV